MEERKSSSSYYDSSSFNSEDGDESSSSSFETIMDSKPGSKIQNGRVEESCLISSVLREQSGMLAELNKKTDKLIGVRRSKDSV